MGSVGLIGYGSLGRLLAEGWLASSALAPAGLAVSTRTPAALASLISRWPGVAAGADNVAVARGAQLLVLCVGPGDLLPLLAGLTPHLPAGAHVVSTASAVTLDDLAGVYDGPVSRVLPNFASEVRAGLSLVCHGAAVAHDARARVEALLGALGTVTVIEERDVEVAIALASCGPGLLASLCAHFARAARRHGHLSDVAAQEMVLAALTGTARLAAERGLGFDDLVARVATHGGVTEAGVEVLARRLPRCSTNCSRPRSRGSATDIRDRLTRPR